VLRPKWPRSGLEVASKWPRSGPKAPKWEGTQLVHRPRSGPEVTPEIGAACIGLRHARPSDVDSKASLGGLWFPSLSRPTRQLSSASSGCY
jgi:hypothetical protein